MSPARPRFQLTITGGMVVNVFSGECYPADVVCVDSRITDVCPPGTAPPGGAVIDAKGKFVLPGLINAHLHIESSMVTPLEYARAVVPHGTLTVIADPHEVANVSGVHGIRQMVEQAARSAADVFFVAPSCVPATPLETAGAELGAAEVSALLEEPYILGLGELMNFPGALAGDTDVLAKLAAARRTGKPIDGHAPGLTGPNLARYVALGVSSEHEATTVAEAREKWRLGMWLMIREGSAAHNLAELLPLAIEARGERMMFVTDDLHPDDLLAGGELDAILRQAVGGGLDPIAAVRMTTWNPAQYFKLPDRGVIAPGRLADLWIVADLVSFRTTAVLKAGRVLWADGAWCGTTQPAAAIADQPDQPEVPALSRSVHLPANLRIKLHTPERTGIARVIGVVPGQIVTRQLAWPVSQGEGGAASSPAGEVCKLAVIERHGRNGNVGLGLVSGLGLGTADVQREGAAVGATVAHDSHNLVIAGTDDEAIHLAAEALRAAGGGFVVVARGRVVALLALPVAGLMADRPVEEVAAGAASVNTAARELGMPGESPLMTLSFLALPVIPELKLTDRGLVDVGAFKHVPLWLE